MRLSLRPTAARRGFTLVELMIVVGIIILLVAMATAAILRFRNTGPHIATQMNLSKIKSALDTQWRAVRDQAQKESISATQLASIVADTTLNLPAATKANNLKVREEYVKARLAQTFPMSFVEALTPPYGLPVYPAYSQYLSSLGITAANAATAAAADVQQAVCLQMIVQRGPSNPGFTPDILGTSASLRLQLTGVSREEFACVDAWGRPLLFTRQYGGTPSTLVLISAGADAKHGLNVSALPGAPKNFSAAVANAGEAEDNVTSRDQ